MAVLSCLCRFVLAERAAEASLESRRARSARAAREPRVVLARCKIQCAINLSMNICLVSANDVM